jgi:hypothetical protein
MYWELKKIPGLPFVIGKETFAYVKDKIWKRINSLRGRALSKVGKEVMSKYAMSIYLLPNTFIHRITLSRK